MALYIKCAQHSLYITFGFMSNWSNPIVYAIVEVCKTGHIIKIIAYIATTCIYHYTLPGLPNLDTNNYTWDWVKLVSPSLYTWYMQWNLYIKSTLGTNKMRSLYMLYTSGLYMQFNNMDKYIVYTWRPVKCGL